jgi:hypothetical protein
MEFECGTRILRVIHRRATRATLYRRDVQRARKITIQFVVVAH